MSIIKPKIRTFKVAFPNSDAMFEFDRYLGDIVGMGDKLADVPTVIGFDDDEKKYVWYPIKKRKTKEFLDAVAKYNKYAKVFSSKFVINGLEEL